MTFPNPLSKSAQLFERASRVIPGSTSRFTIKTSPYHLFLSSAQGAKVVDVDGNELLDFNNNYTSLIHGHAHPAINQAVQKQLSLGTAYSFSNEAEIELAELLCERLPSMDRIRFVNSGSEAVMNAIKAARAYTGRFKSLLHQHLINEGVYLSSGGLGCLSTAMSDADLSHFLGALLKSLRQMGKSSCARHHKR